MSLHTTKKTWLITGASQGLGLCITMAALQAGHHVIACARNVEKARSDNPKVEELGGKWLQLDVTSPDTQSIVQKAAEAVDVCINNAGFFAAGNIEDLSIEEMQATINTNWLGPMRVLKATLPGMRQRRSGTIVYIGSIYGVFPCPNGVAYNCTKTASEMMYETLKTEVAPFGIRTLVINAGMYRTAVLEHSVLPAAGFGKHYVEQTPIGDCLGAVQQIMADPEATIAGNPELFGQRVVEMVDGTGIAADLTKQARVFMGRDALDLAQRKIDLLQQELDASRQIAGSADYEGHQGTGVAGVAHLPSHV